jgi:N-acyl-D-amino-acid deacylase
MRLIFLILFFLPVCSFSQRYDVLLTGGKIVDGTGNGWFFGDVGIKEGKIIAIGRLAPGEAWRVINVKGLIVAPGFIDVHTHIESNDLEVPTADNFIFDGVTSVVTGNCGASKTDLLRYFYQLDSVKTSINVATLIGHNSVRQAVMGDSQRDPTSEEQSAMEGIVDQAMLDGAVGLSTGLIYVPGTYSKTREVIGLAKAASQYQGVYASHIRSEGDEVTEAIAEAINIGRKAHISVQISHFKVTYKPNWGRSVYTIQQIENARKEGINVTIDQYPYVASSKSLNTVLPSWVFSGGNDSSMIRLKDPAIRKRITSEMVKALKAKQMNDYRYAVVAHYAADTALNGKNISQINALRNRKQKSREEAETILDMVENGSAQMVFFSMDERDLKRILQYPQNMFASDAGIARYGSGVPHPRTYGTNARVLARYVREQKFIPLEEAIRRMTSLPAQKYNFRDRGLIREGMAADLVIFNEETVRDESTFDKPHAYSSGVELVIVNGAITMEKGKHTGARNGKVLYGPGFVPRD